MQARCCQIAFLVVALPLLAEAGPARAAGLKEMAPSAVAEDLQFRGAEELRRQGYYPRAAQAYRRLLAAFPDGAHRKQAIEHLYAIAFSWLQDTFEQMRQVHVAARSPLPLGAAFGGALDPVLPDQGTVVRRLLYCRHLLHWSRTKPLFNQERQALALLAFVEASDPQGPRAHKALFLMGRVHLFREDYRQADHCFSRLCERHPKCQYAVEALYRSVFTKMMLFDEESPEKCGRQAAEVRALIEMCLRREDFSQAEKQRLMGCLTAVNLQQAKLAFEEAEKWRRDGHMERARRQYELVYRRYLGTPLAEEARQRLRKMGTKAKKGTTMSPFLFGELPLPGAPDGSAVRSR